MKIFGALIILLMASTSHGQQFAMVNGGSGAGAAVSTVSVGNFILNASSIVNAGSNIFVSTSPTNVVPNITLKGGSAVGIFGVNTANPLKAIHLVGPGGQTGNVASNIDAATGYILESNSSASNLIIQCGHNVSCGTIYGDTALFQWSGSGYDFNNNYLWMMAGGVQRFKMNDNGDVGIKKLPTSGTSLDVIGGGKFTSTVTHQGFSDGLLAAAGTPGEISSGTLSGTFAPVTGAFVSIATITLTAGDWDVAGMCAGLMGGTTASTERYCAISLTANTSDDGHYTGVVEGSISASVNEHIRVMTKQVNVNSTTTVYLTARITATVIGGFTWTTNSILYARRAR